MSTFQSLQNKVLDFFGAADAEMREEVKEAINDVIAEINDEVPYAKHTQATDTFTLTQGSTTVTGIPASDYDHVLRIYLTVLSRAQAPLTYLTYSEWNNRRLYDLGNDIPTHWTYWNNVFYVGPPPDSAYSGTMDYYKFDTALSADSDTGLLTDLYSRWERIIIEGAKARIHEYLATDEDMIQRANNKYQYGIRRFRSWTRRNLNKDPDATRVRNWKERRYNVATSSPYGNVRVF